MMKTQIGLGVLAIPSALNALGMVPGVICLVVVAIITTWSRYVIGAFKLQHREIYSIDDAGGIMFGLIGRLPYRLGSVFVRALPKFPTLFGIRRLTFMTF